MCLSYLSLDPHPRPLNISDTETALNANLSNEWKFFSKHNPWIKGHLHRHRNALCCWPSFPSLDWPCSWQVHSLQLRVLWSCECVWCIALMKCSEKTVSGGEMWGNGENYTSFDHWRCAVKIQIKTKTSVKLTFQLFWTQKLFCVVSLNNQPS